MKRVVFNITELAPDWGRFEVAHCKPEVDPVTHQTNLNYNADDCLYLHKGQVLVVYEELGKLNFAVVEKGRFK